MTKRKQKNFKAIRKYFIDLYIYINEKLNELSNFFGKYRLLELISLRTAYLKRTIYIEVEKIRK